MSKSNAIAALQSELDASVQAGQALKPTQKVVEREQEWPRISASRC